MRETRDQIQKDLDTKLQEQADITRTLGMATVGASTSNPFDSELDRMRAELNAAEPQKILAEAQLASLQSGDSSAPNSALNATADEIIATDPGLSALKSNLAQKRATLLEQLAGLTANHPLRKQTEAQLAEIDQALVDMQNNLRQKAAIRLEQKARADVNRASTVESKLLNDMQKESSAAASASPRLQRASELTADIERLTVALDKTSAQLDKVLFNQKNPIRGIVGLQVGYLLGLGLRHLFVLARAHRMRASSLSSLTRPTAR